MNYEELEENLVFYDFEVFAYDWLVVFENYKTKDITIIHNNKDKLKEFVSTPNLILCGYNNRGYDQYIIKSILSDIQPKEMNDWIISGKGGWEFPDIQGKYVPIPPQIDLMQDTLGLGLKQIEGNIGWNIKESEVDFRLTRPLNEIEIEETVDYCKSDVHILPELWKLRKDYIQAKVTLCEMSKIPLEVGLGMTNAKLTAMFLNAIKKDQPHRRDFDYYNIKGIRWELIPLEVLDYFDKIKDDSISNEEFETSKLETIIGGIPTTVALGGLHGAVPNYFVETDEEHLIINQDVASLYPSIILNYNYVSRNIEDKTLYENVYHTRLKAKKSGDKKTANALKLILNTFYGAMNNQYNDLYDPSMALATCVTGQLLLIELINDLNNKIPNVEFIQYNTDGIMFKLHKNDYDIMINTIHEWEQLHHLQMEEDKILLVAQKDVNNYVIKTEDEHLKFKGGYLSDYQAKETWKHNSLSICAEALVLNLANDTPIEDTINNCNDLSKFQMITKTGSTYEKTFRLLNNQYIEIQKTNRVFAGNDPNKGTIYKFKSKPKDRYDKTANCPEYTLIDGYDTFTINDIDKQFYIDLTIKRLNDFKGGKQNGKSKKRK